jgi:hypothetical protein
MALKQIVYITAKLQANIKTMTIFGELKIRTYNKFLEMLARWNVKMINVLKNYIQIRLCTMQDMIP